MSCQMCNTRRSCLSCVSDDLQKSEAHVAELRGLLTRVMSMLRGVTAAVEDALKTSESRSNGDPGGEKR